eukprot:TRINITY_DN3743_c0_g1_i4.p1 TRINITY_DN3743_c0_g1~~TRINITY_DN3743_c0_g1_i4.p1  ORF type:complete len:598 (-),score=109.93 TRINITY_DN3743_c0_g1_i4:277-2070(-)
MCRHAILFSLSLFFVCVMGGTRYAGNSQSYLGKQRQNEQNHKPHTNQNILNNLIQTKSKVDNKNKGNEAVESLNSLHAQEIEDFCGWSNWGEWSVCSNECEKGTRTRSRKCVCEGGVQISSLMCDGPEEEEGECGGSCCYWKWSRWGNCSKSCDGGSQERHQICICPNKPAGTYDISDCGIETPKTQSRTCNTNPCCNWDHDSFTSWSECTTQCGNGTQTRRQVCKCSSGSSSQTCDGEPLIHQRMCGNANCCMWIDDHSGWSKCSNYCGNETQKMTQYCHCPGSSSSGSSESCHGEPRVYERPCKPEGLLCPKHMDYWKNSKLEDWPTTFSSSLQNNYYTSFICSKNKNNNNRNSNNNMWSDVLGSKSNDPWTNLAKLFIATSLSLESGSYIPKGLNDIMNKSLTLLLNSDHCNPSKNNNNNNNNNKDTYYDEPSYLFISNHLSNGLRDYLNGHMEPEIVEESTSVGVGGGGVGAGGITILEGNSETKGSSGSGSGGNDNYNDFSNNNNNDAFIVETDNEDNKNAELTVVTGSVAATLTVLFTVAGIVTILLVRHRTNKPVDPVVLRAQIDQKNQEESEGDDEDALGPEDLEHLRL